MSAVGKTGGVAAANLGENATKPAEKKMSEGIRDIRNIALGVAGVAGAALVAEAAGVVTLPAVLPTGGVLLGGLVAAGAIEMIAQGVEAAEKALAK